MDADDITSGLEDLAMLGQLAILAQELCQKKKKRLWRRKWVSRRKKSVPLYHEITTEDREKFFANFRLYPEEFNQLLTRFEHFQFC